MEMKKERRRRDLARMKARAVKVCGRYLPRGAKLDPTRVAKLANNMAACSCFWCGNPRHRLKELTMQERRFMAEEIE